MANRPKKRASDSREAVRDGVIPCPYLIAEWVQALGEDKACDVFVALGGTRIQIASKTRNSMLSRTVGKELADRLAHELGAGNIRVPFPPSWITHVLRRRGLSVAEIARTVKRDVSTIHEHIRNGVQMGRKK